MKKHLFIAIAVLIAISITKAQDTVTTPSGLKYIIIEQGTGEKAQNNKAVEVHYTGYLLDGKVFDSSRDRNEPIEFILGNKKVIAGWDEGIALMSIGDKYRLIIPPELAYGSKGAGNVIPPNATLIFDTELISVSDPKEPISNVLLQTILEKDVASAVSQYRALKASDPDKYNFKEAQLNSLGYQLIQVGKTKEALEILKLNAEVYPNSSNVFDSLGEACMLDGQTEQAIENYKKSLEIDPNNKNAQEMLSKLAK
ncbi:MAG TPA: FKBP-type peptidyl-prolyl cis-trans isomerase [Ignavibacteria bacterium]|nr:FKBP-type peptidyl-prolyl cis-trans isomerase [Ignavibacteria bacterium]